jgi:hypothetical protein
LFTSSFPSNNVHPFLSSFHLRDDTYVLVYATSSLIYKPYNVAQPLGLSI